MVKNTNTNAIATPTDMAKKKSTVDGVLPTNDEDVLGPPSVGSAVVRAVAMDETWEAKSELWIRLDMI